MRSRNHLNRRWKNLPLSTCNFQLRNLQPSTWQLGTWLRLGVALRFPRDEEYQAHARADGAVGHVEGGKSNLAAAPLDVKVNEINDVSGPDPVNEVADNPAEDQAEGDLAQQSARVKMMAAEIQDHQGSQGHNGKEVVIPAEKAPGGTGIA